MAILAQDRNATSSSLTLGLSGIDHRLSEDTMMKLQDMLQANEWSDRDMLPHVQDTTPIKSVVVLGVPRPEVHLPIEHQHIVYDARTAVAGMHNQIMCHDALHDCAVYVAVPQ